MGAAPVLQTAIISAGRPGNVPAMERHAAGLRRVWVVPRGQVAAYRRAGAVRVAGVAAGLAAARNRALDLAADAGAWCVQVEDDLRRVRWLPEPGGQPQPVTLGRAAQLIAEAMTETGAHYGGVAPTPNAYFSRRRVTDWGFVVAKLTVSVPGAERYDPALRLKEDWDMTCQHLAAWGQVARRDDVLAEFRQYTNPGGCTPYRTDALEEHCTGLLLARWPGLLRPHARRPHELALRPRPAAA